MIMVIYKDKKNKEIAEGMIRKIDDNKYIGIRIIIKKI